jgi:HPt (histidine-containing phosphotransfer) domain-containing protein
MPHSKKEKSLEKPSVSTFADHEIIHPPNKLRKAIKRASEKEAAEDPVANAEKALAQISSEFSGWMDSECARLDAARQQIKAEGFTKVTREALFLAAHDIKGQAATFGYPEVASPADSLCRLIEHTPETTHIPLSLVDQHVDTVRAIIREGVRAGRAHTADALTRKLRTVTDEFLAHENRDRPDVLEGILAPPLAPDHF